MTHRFTDTLTLDGSTRKREGGYLVADARVARTGIQMYNGSEVGRPDLDTVRVYRAPEQVFDKASMASFANIPVTDDHPSELVTADNWSKYAKGQTDGDIARDGERLRVPLMISDGATVALVDAGKRELSAGYTCDLEWLSGVTPSGEMYDAAQVNIRANHVAVVRAGRAGSEIRIGDGTNDGGKERTKWGVAPVTHVDHKETQTMSNLQTVVLGDKAISVDPAHVAFIDAFKKKAEKDEMTAEEMKREKDELKAKNDKLEKDAATKDAKIADLEAQVLSDADIDARAQTRAALIADAKAIAPTVDTSGMSDADIRKAVVSDKLGADTIKDKDAVYIDARFDIMVEDAKANKPDAFRDASMQHDRKVVHGTTQQTRDSAYGGYLDQLNGVTPQKGA